MDDDGGMQWWAQVGQYEQERREAWERALRDQQLLQEHRNWKEQFNRTELEKEMT